MPSTVFAGYFTTAAELNPREMSDLQKVVIDPGNEQLDRVLSNLDGEQEFVTMPYGDEDGQPDGELHLQRLEVCGRNARHRSHGRRLQLHDGN